MNKTLSLVCAIAGCVFVCAPVYAQDPRWVALDAGVNYWDMITNQSTAQRLAEDPENTTDPDDDVEDYNSFSSRWIKWIPGNPPEAVPDEVNVQHRCIIYDTTHTVRTTTATGTGTAVAIAKFWVDTNVRVYTRTNGNEDPANGIPVGEQLDGKMLQTGGDDEFIVAFYA